MPGVVIPAGVDRKNLDAVLRNLEFFLRRLRALPCCRSAELPDGGFCLFTGSDSASENWVFCHGPVRDEGMPRRALRFFETCGAPFVWPLLGEGRAVLSRFGLREAGRLLAMSRSCEALAEAEGPRVTFAPVRDDAEADRWAEAMWAGFGAGDGAPEALLLLCRAMRTDDALRLVTARVEGRDAGSLLLALDPDAAGVYYFAVPPRYRRRGVATAMMAEALRHARDEGKRQIVLQATPSGVPFYRAAGFEPLGELPLFSASDDVF